MGVIKRQTIQGTTISFIGVLIGFINLVILSPKFFTTDQIGLTQVMLAIVTILAQLGGLGFNNVINRLFPWFRNNSNNHNGFLSLSFLVTGFGFMISLILLFLYLPAFIETNSDRSLLLSRYAYYIPLFFAFFLLFTLLDNFCKVLFNAVIGTFLRDIVLRVINFCLIMLFSLNIIDFSVYILLYILSYAVPSVVIIIYLVGKGEFRFTGFRGFMNKDLRKQIISLSFYGLIAGFSGIAITNIDKYMVNNFIGLGDAGIYSIAVYFATLILIPARSLGKIAVPVSAEAWKNNDLDTINNVYYKSSINQMLIGLIIFVGLVANMDNILRILPEEYASGKMVIIIFSFTNIINVSAGAAGIILNTSSRYKFQTYLMLILIILVITSNFIFIPLLGLTGAAVASLISMFIFTGLTVFVLKYYYGLWPFKAKHLIAAGMSVGIYLVSLFMPQISLIPDILIRSSIVAVLFAAGTLSLNLSEDVNLMYSQVKDAIAGFFNLHKRNNK